MVFRELTGDCGDGHAAVALDEDVDGVLEHPGPQQQRGDVVEHDACMRIDIISPGRAHARSLMDDEREGPRCLYVPGLGKCGTTRMASEMPCSRGSSVSAAGAAATTTTVPSSAAALALTAWPFSLAFAASITVLQQLASSPILSLASTPPLR